MFSGWIKEKTDEEWNKLISQKDVEPITGENEEFSEQEVDNWPETNYNTVYENVRSKSKPVNISEYECE
jgi:hypothetical protein